MTHGSAPILVAGLAAIAFGFASPAHADCIGPDSTTLLWSSPSDGDTGVPQNAILWLLLNRRGVLPAAVALDGVALDVFDAPFFGPASAIDLQQFGPLAEGAHTLEITLPEAAAAQTLSFDVIPEDAPRPESPQIVGIEATDAPSGLCNEILLASECFDTGQDTHLIIRTRASNSLARLVRPLNDANTPLGGTLFWPGECGDPVFFGNSGANTCFTVEDVGPFGVSGQSERACSGDGQLSEAAGCSCSTHAASAFPLVATLLVCLSPSRRKACAQPRTRTLS